MIKTILLRTAMVGAAMTFGATAAHAQAQPDGNSLRPNAQYFEKEFEARKTMGESGESANVFERSKMVASCVQRQAGDEAMDLVGGELTDDEDYDALNGALSRKYRQCMTEESSGLPIDYVGLALVETIVLAKREEMVTPKPVTDMAAAQAFIVGGDDDLPIDKVGRCIAVLAPASIVRVMDTESNSDAEKDALQAAYQSAPQCGVSERPEIEDMVQRRAMVEGLYAWRMMQDS
ncbi:hypothetical protein [Sphingomicrobium sediminis]|uniref:Uncharacterized protein n=1 Tax=Sphingomicrobium sediminis TaxID=2950949 RepID=A0A9X2EGE0_9SPHN|nr:hypothetical protein [Sphingomicrobium sediminis]MCM8557030.1 hypothetical protein [Sphingomicrobium sediminis]